MHNVDGLRSNTSNKHVCRHPCFNNYDFHNAVIHLPIVSESNIIYTEQSLQGCPNLQEDERLPVKVLTPYEALERLIDAKKTIPGLTVAALAGPGEPLTDFDSVKETLKGIRQVYSEILLCLSTNGLMLPIYANHLISLGVNYVTVTVNTVSPEIGAKIYNSITYMGRKYYGVEGANILLQNQISGISYLTSMGISVRMNIVVMKGVNEHEIKDIVQLAKDCGCKLTNILPQTNGKNQNYNGLEAYSSDKLFSLRQKYEEILPQSYYCKPCNATSVETLNTRIFNDFGRSHRKLSKHYRLAVCSQNGILTDEHFGHAVEFYIYDYQDDNITFVENRPIEQYCRGSRKEKEEGRIYKLIKAIEDCNCVICMRIGACPTEALKEKNIDVYTTYHLIEEGIREAVHRLYSGLPKDL